MFVGMQTRPQGGRGIAIKLDEKKGGFRPQGGCSTGSGIERKTRGPSTGNVPRNILVFNVWGMHLRGEEGKTWYQGDRRLECRNRGVRHV